MTEYVILSRDESGYWREKAPEYVVKASSAKRALKACDLEEGTYVAVPARSWNPLIVKVETVSKVSIT